MISLLLAGKSRITSFLSASIIAVSAGLSLAAEQPPAAKQCSPLAISKSGVTWDAHTSAGRFSEGAPGRVGISIFPAGDLVNFTAEELGQRLVTVLKDRDKEIVAECFVDNVIRTDGGTAIGFVVNGVTLKIDGKEFFNMAQLANDKRILDRTAAESTAGRVLLPSRK